MKPCLYKKGKLELLLWCNGIDGVSAAARTQVPSLAQHNRLRIQHCYSCGIGCSCISHSISGLGTSICCRCGQKKKKRMYIIILYRYIMLVLTGIRYTLQIRSSWLIVFKFSIWLFIFHFPILYFLYITPKVKVIKEDRFHLK